MKKKIVITQPLALSKDQRKRLESLGDVKFYDTFPQSEEEWLERAQRADILCSGKFGLKKHVHELQDVFISLPFVATDWVDQEKAKKRGIIVKNSPGCNKDPVAEWIIAMMINLMRRFPRLINTKESVDWYEIHEGESDSPTGKIACIMGAGNVGIKVGEICQVLGMKVDFFRRGDDILEKSKNADVIIDTLEANEETSKIYDQEFFFSLKKGSYFITITGEKLWDADAMIDALDKEILAGVATDCGSMLVGKIDDPLYKKLSSHPKILATPHIAFNSDRRNLICNDMMIDNIEEYLKNS